MRFDTIEETKDLLKKMDKVKEEISIIQEFIDGGYNLNHSIGQGVHYILDTFYEKEDKEAFLHTLLTLKENQMTELERQWELM